MTVDTHKEEKVWGLAFNLFVHQGKAGWSTREYVRVVPLLAGRMPHVRAAGPAPQMAIRRP